MDKTIVENRKARFDYEVLETVECGIVLIGTEMKPLRAGKCNLQDAYAKIKNNELFLMQAFIAKYENARHFSHDESRERKLLVHKKELAKIEKKLNEKQLSAIPLRLYFNDKSKVKVLIGLCRGKKSYDKRESIKKRDQDRDIRRAMK
ncbi:MAG: SsrA-binding protein SmpB [Calditrichaeota bacterium]|nr:SsrA-binding protein SmpB [Calditrichota bacterium]